MDRKLIHLLRTCADKYETREFYTPDQVKDTPGDPSLFMHRAKEPANAEALAFVASCLSFGNRVQFMQRIQHLYDCANGNMDAWIRSGAFERDFPEDGSRCFYRFFTLATMNGFFREYRKLMEEHGTLGEFVRKRCEGDASKAVQAICERFGGCAREPVVPKDTRSACKRVCMFLRWMARDGSAVDLGLWSGFIDKRTLTMPLDTHVVQEACRLGLMKCRSASMSAAKRLTAILEEAFPGDPCRGDFALFGIGVDRHAAESV